MSAKILFRQKTERLTVDRLDRARGELAVEWKGEDLRRSTFHFALQLGMASPDRGDREAEKVKNAEDLPGG
ncbi:MAG: hypothetical protein A2Y69_01360 [Candidatus Aminicenantes bacterium RBG_13_59_9]|nr:MAG: hypothetical protein A2Y69_01360 [Candidatus Aminicenantes bacterium RBG_13_59_9]